MLDGSLGEGGGQILRTALSLSLVTGQEFALEKIRARRAKPGLQRQHLAAVNAAASICSAAVAGAELGSQHLRFQPGPVAPGDYAFDIGSAGSATLVLQTVLPPLVVAEQSSSILIEGGTHNPSAPPFEFFQQAFLPLLTRMGPKVGAKLDRHGFYPAGGGKMRLTISPAPPLRPLELEQRGALVQCRARALVAHLPEHIADRELKVLRRELRIDPHRLRAEAVSARSPANVLLVEAEHEHVTEVFVELGALGVPAETVASRLSARVQRYWAGSGAVDEYLADQLLLPLALAGEGSFTTSVISGHTTTNMEVIRRFLPVDITAAETDGRKLIQISRKNTS